MLGVSGLLLGPFEECASSAGGEVSGAGLRLVTRTYFLSEDCVLFQVTEV